MASIFKRKRTRPIPDGAEIVTKGGKRFARWPGKSGRTKRAELSEAGEAIVVEDASYTIACTDDDGRNLRAAIGLRRARAQAPIFVRCVYRSAFTGELSDELDFSVLSVEGMLRQTMRDRVDEWLGPPTR